MDLETITLSEVSQTEKDKMLWKNPNEIFGQPNIIWYHLYVESKKIIQMNSYTKQKQTQQT